MSKRAAVIAAIRKHYADLGIPLDALSDTEIEMGVRQLADAMKESGKSKEDVTEAMRKAVEIAERNAAERQAALDAAAAAEGGGDATPAASEAEAE